MRRSFHRYVLPLLLILLHLLVAVPALIPSQSRSDDNSRRSPLPQRLHPHYAIPFGIGGFLVSHIVRVGASHFPLPRQRRLRQIARRLEWILLFLLGVTEEFWRWTMVRIVLHLEGGKGGYAGSMNGLSTGGEGGPQNPITKADLWGGIYLMSWTWCLVESLVRPSSPNAQEAS